MMVPPRDGSSQTWSPIVRQKMVTSRDNIITNSQTDDGVIKRRFISDIVTNSQTDNGIIKKWFISNMVENS